MVLHDKEIAQWMLSVGGEWLVLHVDDCDPRVHHRS
jgi:hypothetical protein